MQLIKKTKNNMYIYFTKENVATDDIYHENYQSKSGNIS